MKWEREKRRRKKRREEAAAAATAKPAENAATAEAAEPAAKAGTAGTAATAETAETAGTAATAETAEACASSSKPEPVPLAIQEQKPKMMAKKEKKSRKEKKHKKEKVRPLIQVKEEQEDDDVKPGVSEALWKQGEEWADELTKEWLAQPACDEEEEKFKDFCRRKDLQQVMPDDQSDPAVILVSIGKKSLLGHRCCVQISHVTHVFFQWRITVFQMFVAAMWGTRLNRHREVLLLLPKDPDLSQFQIDVLHPLVFSCCPWCFNFEMLLWYVTRGWGR